MSEQEKQTENNNSEKSKFPKKPNIPKNPFNFYWIYGIIAVAIIVMQLFFTSTPMPEKSTNEFIENMLKQHHVTKVVVIPSDNTAEITIGKDFLKLPQYAADNLEKHKDGPHYRVKIASVDKFEERIKEAQKDFLPEQRIDAVSENRTSWADQLSWIIPIVLMIVIWIIIMRRMGGGAGGGQIFNIGKSEATLFDKNTNVNITFNDVAGLEGAKIEIKEIVDFLKVFLGGILGLGAYLRII